jgi:DNA polymerase-3 subunit delta'
MENRTFNPDIGHYNIQENILASIRNNRLPHAYLFHGKEGIGKDAFAIELAKLLNCEKGPYYICQKCPSCIKIGKLEHPDIKFIFPVPATTSAKPEVIAEAICDKATNPYKKITFAGKNTFISIETIRELKHEAMFALYEGKKKIYIITEAEEMRPEAANALLKILEEPPSNLMIILVTSKIHRIIPTIRSRSQLIRFSPLEGDQILKIIQKYHTDPPEHLANIIRLANGNIKIAFAFIEEDILEQRDRAIDLLRKMVIIEKSHELLNLINEITSSRDRHSMVMILFFLLTWFRDAVHFQVDPEKTDTLINMDLQKNIKGFVEGYPNADYQNLITHTQNAICELDDPRNINPTLIFTNLSIKLNCLIKDRNTCLPN